MTLCPHTLLWGNLNNASSSYSPINMAEGVN